MTTNSHVLVFERKSSVLAFVLVASPLTDVLGDWLAWKVAEVEKRPVALDEEHLLVL